MRERKHLFSDGVFSLQLIEVLKLKILLFFPASWESAQKGHMFQEAIDYLPSLFLTCGLMNQSK